MTATEILREEHRVIERVLRALETAARRVEEGAAVRPGFFLDAAEFIRGFADGCHHRKEEGVLFPAMIASGMPREGGPVGRMLEEHEQGRAYTRAMREAAERWQAGDPSARAAVVGSALGYITLLRQHIAKENDILFVMAGRIVPAARQAEVAADFERVEEEETGHGVHEKYHRLAEALEKEVSP